MNVRAIARMRRLHIELRTIANAVRLAISIMWQADARLLAALIALNLAAGILPLGQIAAMAHLIQALVSGMEQSAIPAKVYLLVGAILGVALLTYLVRYAASAVDHAAQAKLQFFAQMLVARKAASLDLAAFDDPEFHNTIQNATRDGVYRPLGVLRKVLQAISAAAGVIALCLVFTDGRSWMPAILLTASALAYAAGHGARIQKVVARQELAENERSAQHLQWLLTTTHTAKEIRLMSLAGYFERRLRQLHELALTVHQAVARHGWKMEGSAGLVQSAVAPLLVAALARQAFHHELSIGEFSLLTQSIYGLSNTGGTLLGAVASLHEQATQMKPFLRFHALEPMLERKRPDVFVPRVADGVVVEFREVSFRYPQSARDTLRRVSFVLRPAEPTAIVGHNGAGKSTIVKLLGGLYRPTSGQILFNGVDIAEMDREQLRSYLSIVMQDFKIFPISVRDNIGVGAVHRLADTADIERAAAAAGLHPFVARMPRGYDTVIGREFSDGAELSGGQQQLLAVARTLFKQAPVIVMDEPSASLDATNEANVFRRVFQQARQQTVLLISHRLHAARYADRLLVLKEGEVVESGSHDQLIATPGYYQTLYHAYEHVAAA